MTTCYRISPEVPGRLGNRTILDRSTFPPKVDQLYFMFDGWLGDGIVESFPCFLVTKILSNALAENGLSGYQLADVVIEVSPEFMELYPTRTLPSFVRLVPVGRAGEDDFSLDFSNTLLVSKRAYLVLAQHGLANAEVEEVEY